MPTIEDRMRNFGNAMKGALGGDIEVLSGAGKFMRKAMAVRANTYSNSRANVGVTDLLNSHPNVFKFDQPQLFGLGQENGARAQAVNMSGEDIEKLNANGQKLHDYIAGALKASGSDINGTQSKYTVADRVASFINIRGDLVKKFDGQQEEQKQAYKDAINKLPDTEMPALVKKSNIQAFEAEQAKQRKAFTEKLAEKNRELQNLYLASAGVGRDPALDQLLAQQRVMSWQSAKTLKEAADEKQARSNDKTGTVGLSRAEFSDLTRFDIPGGGVINVSGNNMSTEFNPLWSREKKQAIVEGMIEIAVAKGWTPLKINSTDQTFKELAYQICTARGIPFEIDKFSPSQAVLDNAQELRKQQAAKDSAAATKVQSGMEETFKNAGKNESAESFAKKYAERLVEIDNAQAKTQAGLTSPTPPPSLK